VTEVATGPLFGDNAIEGVVTVKVAVPEFVAASVAITALPPVVETGTAKVAEKVPVPEAVMETGFVVNAFPPNVTVTAEFGAKFEPVIVTDVPTGPVVGFNVSVGAVTVKVAVAVWAEASVAATVLAPPVEVGTANVQVNVPEVPVCIGVGLVVTDTPLKVIVTVEEAAKPWPDAVTVVPMSPVTGFKVNDALTV